MVYDMVGSEDYECINCVFDEGYDVFNEFLKAKPMADNWQPIRVVRVPVDDGHPGLPSDFPTLGTTELIMRTRAMFALRDMLEEGGEILPLATDDGVALFVLNVTRVLDAMDEASSRMWRFSDGRIKYVWAHTLYEPVVRDVPFFKLPYYGSPILVGEPFKRRVEEAGLVGLDFELAWSPDGGAVKKRFW